MTVVRRVVDLSHPLDDATQVFPGDPPVSLTSVAAVDQDGFNLLRVQMGSQSGTHVDAPRHFFAGGAGVDVMDLRLFCGTGVVADLRGIRARHAVTWADLGRVRDRLRPGVVLLLHTGWSDRWGDDTYFDHPYLAAEAAERVMATGVRTVGIDAPSLDETVLNDETVPEEKSFPAHRAVLGVGGVIVENLTNLGAVDFPEPLVSVLPLRLTAADGAPVRAVAIDLGWGPLPSALNRPTT